MDFITVSKAGQTRTVRARFERAFRGMGWAVVGENPAQAAAPAVKPAEDLEALSYAELREMAAEREVEPEGRKKADYVEALRRFGRYGRRDMRAGE